MKKILFSLCAIVVIFAFIGTASATPIFEDNFDSENGGIGVISYNSFDNWNVTDGTVDLIGNGFYDFLPGNGLYVDMDGSTSNAGKMIKTDALVLNAGQQYILQFDLAGNQRNGSTEQVTVLVGLGGLLNNTYSMGQSDPFTTYTEYFTVGTDTSVALSFEGIGGDDIGMLLDNVSVDPVPEPSTMLLLAFGLLGLVGVSRKKLF